MRTEDFKEFVKTAKKFYDRKNRVPICDNVLFYGSTAKIVNFTDEVSVAMDTGDVVFKKPFIISFLEFEKVINKVKSSPISFSVKGNNQISVETNKGTFTFQNEKEEELEDFPLFPKDESGLKLFTTISINELELIKKAENFVAVDELRPMMCNVLIDKNNIVGTDSHSLCFYPSETERERSFVIPKKIAKHISLSKNNITVMLDEAGKHTAAIVDGNITIFYKQTDGVYPNYMAAIPTDNPVSVIVDTKEFMEVLDTSSISMNPSSEMVRLETKGNELSLQTQDIDLSKSFKGTVKAKTEGDDIAIGFCYSKMVNLLKAEKQEQTAFSFSDPNRAMIVNEYCLLMPMSING